MKDPMMSYYQDIKSGKINAGVAIRSIYDRLVKESKRSAKWVYRPELGLYVIAFIEKFCKHSKGKWAGAPLLLEPFQKAAIMAAFSFVSKKTGKRRFRKVLLLVARKNGKSTLAAAIMLYLLIADGEGGAEIYSIATKRDQAKIVFNEARNMIRQSEELREIITLHRTDIEFSNSFSKFEALASDTNGLDGLNSHGVTIDELHAIKGMELYELMEQSMSSREQPMLFMTTTAGTLRESIYDERYDYAKRVAEWQPGFHDDEFLPLLYELDSDEEWTDPECWIKANPGLGSIKKMDYLVKAVAEAQRSPRKISGVMCKDFNRRQSSEGSWLSFQEVKNRLKFEMSDIRDTYAIGGVDLSSTSDLTCATILVVKEKMAYVLQKYFIPEDVVEKKIKDDGIRYDLYEKAGWVTFCPGYKVNYSMVTEWFCKMRDEHLISLIWIGYDPWSSQYWTEEMKQNGFVLEQVVQGARTMSAPMKDLAAEIKAKKVNYNQNPVLIWNLTNTNEKIDENENIRPVKKMNKKLRIDGTVSLIDAWVLYLTHREEYLSYMEDLN